MEGFTWGWLKKDHENFKKFYSTKYEIQQVTKYIDKIIDGLTKRYSPPIRANCCHLIKMMLTYGLQKRKTKTAFNRILKLIGGEDSDEIDTALDTLIFFNHEEKISIEVTRHILHVERFSEKGFHLIGKNQSKLVSRLLSIALRHDSLNENWLREYE